jgi:dienelactone hydrolase
MCHADGLGRQASRHIVRNDVTVPLPTGESMPGVVCHPAGSPARSILLISDIYGMTPFYLDVAGELADAGFAALVANYYFRLGELEELTREAAHARRSKLDEAQALRDLDATVNWLKVQFGGPMSPVGLVGFCLGGTLALDLAVERADLAVVSYYGLVAGMGGATAVPAPLDVTDRINGPVLAFWGDEDHVVDMADVDRFARLMAAHRVDYEQTVYPGIGHGFLSGLADESRKDHVSALESWRRTLEFFRQELGSGYRVSAEH